MEFQLLSPYSKGITFHLNQINSVRYVGFLNCHMNYTGLFHRAIAQSGSTRCPWALQSDVGEYTNLVAKILNCPTTSSQELVDCLRTKDATEIVNTRGKYVLSFVSYLISVLRLIIKIHFVIQGLGMYPVTFAPRIDAERDSPFLPDDPARLISRKQFNSVPVIAGVTKDEGGIFAAGNIVHTGLHNIKNSQDPFSLGMIADGVELKEFNKDPIKSVLYAIGMEKRKNGYDIAKKVYDHYFVNNKNKETYQQFAEVKILV